MYTWDMRSYLNMLQFQPDTMLQLYWHISFSPVIIIIRGSQTYVNIGSQTYVISEWWGHKISPSDFVMGSFTVKGNRILRQCSVVNCKNSRVKVIKITISKLILRKSKVNTSNYCSYDIMFK